MCFYHVTEDQRVDNPLTLQARINAGEVKLDPINVEDYVDSNPQLEHLELRTQVNEVKKNNIHFMNYSVAPRRKRSRLEASLDTKEGLLQSTQQGSSPTKHDQKSPRRILPRRYAAAGRRSMDHQQPSQQKTGRLWKLDGPLEDEALPGGILRIHYRTDIWALNAGWIQEEEDDEEDAGGRARRDQEPLEYDLNAGNNDYEDSEDRYGEPKTQAPATFEDQWMEVDLNGALDVVDAGFDLNQSLTMEQIASIKTEAKREQLRREKYQMPGVGRFSSVSDFFHALAQQHAREFDEYEAVVNSLEGNGIFTVQTMLTISENAWMEYYIPHELSATARRNLRSSIMQALQNSKITAEYIDLTMLDGSDDDEAEDGPAPKRRAFGFSNGR